LAHGCIKRKIRAIKTPGVGRFSTQGASTAGRWKLQNKSERGILAGKFSEIDAGGSIAETVSVGGGHHAGSRLNS
jgi:hypothetical protein